ncbi:hypothetical protein J1N35_032519 [Gossypium stocksii]|uniref:Uncharacterized protein n=1 Tax=Gossypium stocksii TaxID=47602 RepID=A0A9D3V3S1_9ROSI|nr:hypothetical protein J1N35_032519 [Gossypium stocksii]
MATIDEEISIKKRSRAGFSKDIEIVDNLTLKAIRFVLRPSKAKATPGLTRSLSNNTVKKGTFNLPSGFPP